MFVCYAHMFPSRASFENYGHDSVLFFTGWNFSEYLGKRATLAYLHVLSLSSQSRRVITVYEFPLVLHASVHPRHSRYSSGAAYRGKVLTHTWKRKGDLVSLTLRKQMVLFMSETFPSSSMKNYHCSVNWTILRMWENRAGLWTLCISRLFLRMLSECMNFTEPFKRCCGTNWGGI